MYTIPSLSLEDIEGMSLLEIDERIKYLGELKRNDKKYSLKDLSMILFYSSTYSQSLSNAKSGSAGEIEKNFHKTIDSLLDLNGNLDSEMHGDKVGDDLSTIFK